MTQTTAPRFDAAAAATVAAFIASRPETDPQRQSAEEKVLELARSRFDNDAREILKFMEIVDRAAAVRVGLAALQE